MTTPTTSTGPTTPTTQGAPLEATTTPRVRRWPFLLLAALVLLAALTYAAAWLRAYSLSREFLANAEASFTAENYLEALSGYQDFDETRGRYVFRGGYAQVVRIWSDPYAWPRPATVAEAEARVNDIIDTQLSLADAEGFVQANIGQANPYLGRIYLRTGELYEQEGDTRSAEEVYASVAELFPRERTLIERAEENLARLEQPADD